MLAAHPGPLPLALRQPFLQRLAIVAGAATAFAVLTTFQEGFALRYAGEAAPWVGLLKARLVDWYACALLMPVIFWFSKRFPVKPGQWRNHLPILLLASVPLAILKEAIFVAVGEFFRPGVFDLAKILSEDLSYEVMVVWALFAAAHLFIQPKPQDKRQARDDGAATEIQVRTRRGLEYVAVQEIELADAQGNYTRLVTPRGNFLVRETMAGMEARLGDAFVRVHRSAIVRRDRIVRVESVTRGGYMIHLRSGERVRGGRSYRATIRSLDIGG
jgi:hypothetical protein